MTAAQVLHDRGKAEVLLRQLVLKFGAVPDGLRERVRKASGNELDGWPDRIIMASSVDGMLGEMSRRDRG